MPSDAEPNTSSDLPEETNELARRARGGNRDSFQHLFRRVAPALYAFACARIGWRWQDAEDAVAETWVRAWQKFDDYDPNRSFRAWVFGFATRVVLETQRRLARETGLAAAPTFDLASHPVDATSVSRRVAQDEALRRFVVWARELSDYEREVLILRGLQGWAHEQVAETLGRSLHAVKECWRRVLRKVSERGDSPVPVAEWDALDADESRTT